MLCRRQSSVSFAPASYSLTIPMICSSVNRLVRICPPPERRSNRFSFRLAPFQGAGSRRWGMAWSPQQIAERLRLDFADDAAMRISHEAVYQALYVQGRGALRRELTQCLRTGRALRVPRARTRGRGKSFVTPEVLISERPAEAADRAVPGH